MSDKKHIDRLFQESFKDFEATPSDAVWENIEAKLKQKKKKHRVIPIWWRYAGAAALLLLLLTIGTIYFNNNDKTPAIQVTDTENTKPEKDNSTRLNKVDEDATIVNADSNENNHLDNTSSQTKTEEPSPNKITPSKESSIAETSSSNNKGKKASNSSAEKAQNVINKLLDTENNHVVASNSSEKNDRNKTLNKEENNIAFTEHSEENKDIEKLQNTINNSSAVASDSEKDRPTVQQKNTALINQERTKEIINGTSKNSDIITKTEKENIEVVINNDPVEENNLTIEEAIDKTKDIIEEEEKSNRWSIAPNAAPVYFNTLGKGSSIGGSQFNNNSKSGELNMSYGISTSYAINKKLSIRSGINKVNLGYNTNGAVIFQTIGKTSSSLALQNVDAIETNIDNSSAPEKVSLVSSESFTSNDAPESFPSSNNISINQDMGYIEIPLEFQYALSNKKLGVNLIGGFSSFFLDNNKIYSEVEGGERKLLGKANNINKISYSANFGLGLNYQMSKKIDLNLEPMFKYQINTFNNTSGDFKPYFIGVYTGFAIKF
ncbi:hypothetical protein Q4Q35_19405 [Flavivirga aquimarina]|uniref:Outer membrane protein beta-barrel domain-containing protein n=1 Tax=Flavivirga aquimarina TaxID=2027862 RepID=A0ABT8WFN5_9FLAO|nr:hypothetical protein [Flavivirga aquimarina]MDO5971974.1 hypothetical protein [Flavivirga aquimarina]